MDTGSAVKRKFYTAKYDRIFKAIFYNEKDFHLMEALLSQCLGYEIKIIKYIETELNVRNKKERVKRLDCLIEGKGEKYNLELNTNFNEATKVRNLNYFTSFYSQQTMRGKKYDAKTKFIHIDLSYGLSENIPIKEIYTLKGDSGNKYTEQIEFIVFNMDKIKRVWYDKSEEVKDYKYLLMLDLENSELENYEGKDEIMREYENRVTELNESDKFIWPLTPEEDEEYITNTRISNAYEEGGLEQQKIIAKNMIDLDIPIKDIIKCTNLTKEEIEKL